MKTVVGSESSKKWKIIRRSDMYNIMSFRPNISESKRQYEDDLKTRFWRLYGKVFWGPLQRFVRRSYNTYSCTYSKYDKGWWKKFFPRVVTEDHAMSDWTLFERWNVKSPSLLHLFIVGFFFYKMKSFYSNHAYKINNYDYKKKFYWYRPFIYVAKLVEYIYSSGYTCCGNHRWLDEEDDSDRFELTASGSEGTMDGTNYWSEGYIHCERCNTPIKVHSDSL